MAPNSSPATEKRRDAATNGGISATTTLIAAPAIVRAQSAALKVGVLLPKADPPTHDAADALAVEPRQEDAVPFPQVELGHLRGRHPFERALGAVDELALGGRRRVDEHDPVLKDVIMSTAVQHGPGTNVIVDALNKVGKNE